MIKRLNTEHVKVSNTRDENENYVFWAEVTMSYQVKDGEGNPVSKQQTYIIKWNATNDNYEWYGAKKE